MLIPSFMFGYILLCSLTISSISANLDFHPINFNDELSLQERNYLEKTTEEELNNFVTLGLESIDQVKRLEKNLLNHQIHVHDGTLSHSTLLDSLPNNQSKVDGDIALKIVKSGQFFYNSKCSPKQISGVKCEKFLSAKNIPSRSALLKECDQAQDINTDARHQFRRLLPAFYKDGFYDMELSQEELSPRKISTHFVSEREMLEDQANVFFPLWTQFIEHDISKPIVTTMHDGSHIACCDKYNYKHQPRYQHPACAPLIGKSSNDRFAQDVCLNYIRSGLALPRTCNFQSASQFNLATGKMDLSQLYGYTANEESKMRLFKSGLIKSTRSGEIHQSLLPMVDADKNRFCAFHSKEANQQCFMAGDSRVNHSPMTIALYTIFLRNHNQIAKLLEKRDQNASDEELFQRAKSLNIDIYNRIVFEEWLPAVFGEDFSKKVKENAKATGTSEIKDKLQVSNEVAVAAIRFYFSMLPKHLNYYSNGSYSSNHQGNEVFSYLNIFDYKDQMYRPSLEYSPTLLNIILEAAFHQQAMRMDPFYEESFIPKNLTSLTTLHADILAFDIQRGRDHGTQTYVKYLESYSGKKVNSWRDLENVMTKENIKKLETIYKNLENIDLLIGGLFEQRANGSILGETFLHILGEQLSRTYKWYMDFKSSLTSLDGSLEKITAVDLICSNSDLKTIPKNIFHVTSNRNPLISCDEHIQILRT